MPGNPENETITVQAPLKQRWQEDTHTNLLDWVAGAHPEESQPRPFEDVGPYGQGPEDGSLHNTTDDRGSERARQLVAPSSRIDARIRARRAVLAATGSRSLTIEHVRLGIVVEVLEFTFLGEIRPKEDAEPSLVAEFAVSDLPPDDQLILAPGAGFHVTVAGDPHQAIGRPCHITALRLRRFSNWSADEIQRASAAAKELSKIFEGDAEP